MLEVRARPDDVGAASVATLLSRDDGPDVDRAGLCMHMGALTAVPPLYV